MRISLLKKVSKGFLATVIGSILIVSIISNFMIDKRFNQYLSQEHNKKIKKLRSLVEDLYNDDLQLSSDDLEQISRYSIMEEFYIEIRNSENQIIFTSGKSNLAHKKMMNSMMGRRHEDKLGEYIEEVLPLIRDNQKFGYMTIGYFGSFNLSKEDLGFKDTLNKSFIISVTAALIFGLIISYILSKQITNPLIKLTKVSNEMRKGDLNIRSEVKSNTIEIQELSNSINYLAETLQNQELLRRRLTSDMAHELRTPLATLQTHIEALIDGIWEPTSERLESCYEEVLRLTKLVTSLKDIDKLEQSNLYLNKEELNLTLEIKKIVETMKPLYKKKNIRLNFNEDNNIIALIDKDKLKQIMYNLLSNSLKYSNENSSVEVIVNKDEKDITIIVKDEGIGISKDDLPHVFERFYRGDKSRSKKTGGTGIGLTIVKTLVEVHKGKIEIESEPKKGTVVTIKIPINKKEL
ncbi:signal transduction histidine kinase [Gottschalkia purinilytica]|uniref:histidine kinase n=1 Tax=Gottschalkia purinilytica TaxID=1503 RepID=A0A0L0W6C2_GOTPU|nr:HAMP domain-containing sensor histidine kinase [Gottschalkia purinilytica]KNF07027.1 signal transduction histidine kinase [Gottschalkia purinilytica]